MIWYTLLCIMTVIIIGGWLYIMTEEHELTNLKKEINKLEKEL